MYPTKEEILQHIVKHPANESDVQHLAAWKRDCYDRRWSSKTDAEKREDLKEILWTLHGLHRNRKPRLELPKLTIALARGLEWAYNPRAHAIYGYRPSIISALHELGHALDPKRGKPGELSACAYSIGLFRTCFPKAYAKLKWRGHMLVPRV